MLGILEKVVWVAAALMALAVGLFFLILGTPSTRPYIATRSDEVPKNVWDRLIAPDVRQELQDRRAEIAKTKGGRRRRGTEKFLRVNVDMYQRIANNNDAFREAMKASSEVRTREDGSSTLLIKDFGENNLFVRAGFQENDEIESINGEPIDFENIKRREALGYYSRFKADFEAGKPLSVEVIRAGKPVTLWFGPDWLGE